MNNELNLKQKSLQKQKLREKRIKALTEKLKSNIAKRKKTKVLNKNG